MRTFIPKPETQSHAMQSHFTTANQAPMGAVLQAYKDKTAQRMEMDDDELLQGKFEETAQRAAFDDEEEF
ncbi:hypothetical protein EZS27_005562 [termite gut metagenome]|uniref:Uncharacterized protein n=1 Tax=termite gut metagenome TaxID=433724 RepID=A0A5J4SLZ0_9ZZZZ